MSEIWVDELILLAESNLSTVYILIYLFLDIKNNLKCYANTLREMQFGAFIVEWSFNLFFIFRKELCETSIYT